MKRVKIMLTSLAVLAVVGGALAFKAKYSTTYCSAATVSGVACTQIASCPNRVFNSTTIGANATRVCTTTPLNGTCGNAQNPLACTTTSTSLIANGD